MSKATQAGHGNLDQRKPAVDLSPIKGKCHVCPTVSHVWAYIKHGKAHVCSAQCFKTYQESRYVTHLE